MDTQTKLETITIPIYQTGNLIYQGIPLTSVEDFITLLNDNPQVQHWLVQHRDLVIQTSQRNVTVRYQTNYKTQPITCLFSPELGRFSQVIVSKLASKIRHYLSSFTAATFTSPTQIDPTPQPQLGLAYGGSDIPNLMMVQLITACFLVFLLKTKLTTVLSQVVFPRSTTKVGGGEIPPAPALSRLPDRTRANWRRRALQINWVDNDNLEIDSIPRRIVLLVTMVSNFFQFYLKVSNNHSYTTSYVMEAEIYDYFRSIRLDPSTPLSTRQLAQSVTEFHGSNVATRSRQTLPVNIELSTNRRRAKAYKVSLAGLTYSSQPKVFFYLATGHDVDYVTLDNKLPTDSNRQLTECYRTIISTLTQLNETFRFFHGDLHLQNILIHTDRSRCKFFDFDFSSCMGRPELSNTKLFEYKGVIGKDRFLKLYRDNDDWLVGFLCFYDAYRLFISINLNNPHGMDTLYGLDTPIRNRFIDCNTNQIVAEIQKLPDWIAFLRNVRELGESNSMENFCKWYRYFKFGRDVFNRFFCELSQVEVIYRNITGTAPPDV